MFKSVGIPLIVLIAITGLYYLIFPTPPLQRATQQVLDNAGTIVATQDRGKIASMLQDFLTDNARIRLEVSFPSIAQPGGGKADAQEFDKQSFMAFVDNILYSVQKYGYEGRLTAYKISADGKTAALSITSHEWAEDVSYFSGVHVNMGFKSTTTCEAEVVFTAAKPKFDKMTCKMQLHSMPKSG